MDKKMICGILLTVIGFVIFAFCFIDAVLNPAGVVVGPAGSYVIGGLLGALLFQETLIPFILSFIVMVLGLGLCFWRAFSKEK